MIDNENGKPNPYIEFLTKATAEFMTFPRILALSHVTKLLKAGLVIKEDKRRALLDFLTEQFEQSSITDEGLKISFDLDESYFDLERSTYSHDQILHLELTEEDTKEFETNMEKVTEKFVSDAIEKIFVPGRVKSWKERAASILEAERKQGLKVSRDIQAIWGNALHLMEMLTSICLSLGEDFNEKHRVTESQNGNAKFAVLTRLHARGCQVSQEIFLLLKSGFADGAHARWRTLDELAVIATFLAEQKNEVAQQYMDHIYVKKWQAKDEALEHFKSMGFPPPTPEEINSIDKNYGEVCAKYGKPFTGNYGWAASALGIKGPNLHDIENKVGWTRLRYFNNMANHNVHADVTGIAFRLTSLDYDDELITGQSIFGLSDPAWNTANSLILLTSALVFSMSEDDLYTIDMLAIMQLRDEVYEAFGLADEQLGKFVKDDPHAVD